MAGAAAAPPEAAMAGFGSVAGEADPAAVDMALQTRTGLRARQYQAELFEEACKRNILAFIDTGAGKTLIAILLIRKKAKELYVDGVKRKVTVFLAPKVGLVLQQAEVLREHTGLDTRGYVGSMGVDLWEAREWRAQMAAQEVMVMTHDILLNSLRHGFMSLREVNLLVFDEAHHAKKRHPYNVIMREFYFSPRLQKRERPHIFGMTASPLDKRLRASAGEVTSFFGELEANLDSQVVTVADRTLLESVAPLPASELLPFPRAQQEARVQELVGALQQLGVELRLHGDTVRERMREQAIKLQGLGRHGLAFDAEKVRTECHVVARALQSVTLAAQELGLLPAARFMVECLRPAARAAAAAEKQLARQREAAAAAAAHYHPADLGLHCIEEDEWFEGRGDSMRAARASSSSSCRDDEVGVLTRVMLAAAGHFRHLLAPASPDWFAYSEVQAELLGWPGVCEALGRAMDGILGATDWAGLGSELAATRSAADWRHASLLTPKVAALLLRLRDCKALVDEAAETSGSGRWCGIVFCQRKSTVAVLDWVARQLPPLRFLQTAAIMGCSYSPGQLKRQQDVLTRFKAGRLNLLMATAVAEEGLDLTRCRLVVRFDLPHTPLEFIQSRGRARARNSRMVLLVEDGRAEDLELVAAVHKCEESMRLEAMQRRWHAREGDFSSDEEDGADEDADAAALADAEARGDPDFELSVPATGARVSLTGAKSLLYHYCNSLPSDAYTLLQPRFSTASTASGGFRSKVVLPNNAPVQVAEGGEMRRRQAAVASACLAAIRALHEAGSFDDHLLPAAGVAHSSCDTLARADDESSPAAGPAAPGGDGVAALDGRGLPPPLLRPKRPDALAWPGGASPCGPCAPDSARLELCLYRLRLVTARPREGTAPRKLTAQQQAARLAEVEGQALGLLLPARLPPLPPVPVELVPGLATTLSLEPCGRAAASVGQYRLAQAWHQLLLHRREPPAAKRQRPAGAGADPSPPPAKRRRLGGAKAASCGGSGAAAAAAAGGVAAGQPEREKGEFAAERPAGPEGAAAPPQPPAAESEQAAAGGSPAWQLEHGEGEAAPETVAGREAAAAPQQPATEPGQARSAAGGVECSPADGQAPVQPEASAVGGQDPSATHAWFCVVPLTMQHGRPQGVDWPAIQQAARPGPLPAEWQALSAAQARALLQGCAVKTPHNGLSYQVVDVAEGASIDDPMPAGADLRARRRPPPGPEEPAGQEQQQEPLTYAQYYLRRWGVQLQPTAYMLRCTGKELRRRHEGALGRALAPGEACVLLPPQLCAVQPLRAAALAAARHVPPLLWWLHALLLAGELRERLSPPDGPRPALLLVAEALTPGFSHTHLSFERLETLGDAFLKYDACCHVFHAYPAAHEGQLAECKQLVISNRNLGVAGRRLGLLGLMSHAAEAMDWATGCRHEVRRVSVKVVADCVEALIGCFYVGGGEACASALLRRLGLLPPMPPIARALPAEVPHERSPLARKLEALLGYSFRDLGLLREACTHCSWPDQSSACYQRLEFLGDAALDLLVTRFYIIGYRDVEPGKLHDLRSASVNNTRLAVIAAWHSLHAFLRYCSPRLFGEVAGFVDSVRKARSGDVSDLVEKSQSYVQRMVQFSARSYKRRGHDSVGARLTSWAGPDPSRVRFPSAIRPAPPLPPRPLPGPRAAARRRSWPAPPGSAQEDPVTRGALGELLSAGFGVGFSAAPKVLGDLFEALLGAVYVDSGGSLDRLWQVLWPFLQPMVHPDKVPVHPVRAVQELAASAGLQAAFRREACAEPGRFAMATVVAGRIVGKCESAPTREHARMLSADLAVQNWSEALVAELRALQQQPPQQPPQQPQVAEKQARRAGQAAGGAGVGEQPETAAAAGSAQEAAAAEPQAYEERAQQAQQLGQAAAGISTVQGMRNEQPEAEAGAGSGKVAAAEEPPPPPQQQQQQQPAVTGEHAAGGQAGPAPAAAAAAVAGGAAAAPAVDAGEPGSGGGPATAAPKRPATQPPPAAEPAAKRQAVAAAPGQPQAPACDILPAFLRAADVAQPAQARPQQPPDARATTQPGQPQAAAPAAAMPAGRAGPLSSLRIPKEWLARMRRK